MSTVLITPADAQRMLDIAGFMAGFVVGVGLVLALFLPFITRSDPADE